MEEIIIERFFSIKSKYIARTKGKLFHLGNIYYLKPIRFSFLGVFNAAPKTVNFVGFSLLKG